MSSSHSNSNSKKVYRQPEKLTIQTVVAAWQEIKPKVEEMFNKVHAYDVSYVATNSALQPIRVELERIEFTPWDRFVISVMKILPGDQESAEDKQRSARIEKCQQTIKKETDLLVNMKDQILVVVDEVGVITRKAYSLAHAWAEAVTAIAEKDMLTRAITSEELIHIKGLAAVVNEIQFPVNATEAIRKSLTGVWYDDWDYAHRFAISGPIKEGTIGNHFFGDDFQSKWTYCYGEDSVTNESINEDIMRRITTLEEIARFFSSSSSKKSDTQTV
jgi:hypothetical protein